MESSCTLTVTFADSARRHLVKFVVILLLAPFICSSQNAEAKLNGNWYVELNHNSIGFVRTVMTFEASENEYIAYTRKGADKIILGGWTSFLSRTLTSNFKDGSLMRIESGQYETIGDSINISGIFTSILGEFPIRGVVDHHSFYMTITDKNQNQIGTMMGFRQLPTLPISDYNQFFRNIASLTKDKIYDRKLLQTREWKSFEKDMTKVSARLQDDVEMLFAFYYFGSKLPFSHYSLYKVQKNDQPRASETTSEAPLQKRVSLEEQSPSTAYMKVTYFDGSAAEMDSIFDIVVRKDYRNLIVDLRNNPGGNVEAGMSFASHVADSTFYGGIFLTQKYFNNHSVLPTAAQYVQFPHFTENNYDLLLKGIHSTEGLCLKVLPKEPVFRGNLYLLTNGRTGSTCEPIVYGLQHRKRATVVGTATAGAMLSGETFVLGDGYQMMIPTADYYTVDGYRIDGKGVAPDVATGAEDALQYVLTNLIKE